MNFYDIMKPKHQKALTEAIHWNNLFNVLLARFEWEGLPDSIPQEFLEGMLICNGTVGLGMDEYGSGNYYAVPGAYNDEIQGYLPTHYTGQITNVRVSGEVGKDIAVGWNNSTLKPDLILMQYASILTEIDVSEKINVLFARFMRVPKVHDEKEKKAIVSTIQNIIDGKVDAWVSENVHADELIEGIQKEPFLDLTDVKEIDKLQYLNQYRDNVIKRFFQLYGQKTQVTSKMAQMSVKEAGAKDSLSMILTLDALRQREKFCDDCNKLFGFEMSVKLTKCWQDELEEMDAMNYLEGGMPQKEEDAQGFEGGGNDESTGGEEN